MSTRAPASAVFAQLVLTGCEPFIGQHQLGVSLVTGRCDMRLVVHLRKDTRFIESPWHHLHDVGPEATEFRSINGAIGSGSLQIVIGMKTGQFEADIDRHNPAQDLWNMMAHNIKEVIPPWFRRRKADTA